MPEAPDSAASSSVSDAVSALPPLREVIAEHGLAARKGLGQHFLLDLNLTGRIARAGKAVKGAKIIEIGPGPGGLTRALLALGAAHVIAIEKDRRCQEALKPLISAAQGRLTVVEDDALRVDESALIASLREGSCDDNVRVIASLREGSCDDDVRVIASLRGGSCDDNVRICGDDVRVIANLPYNIATPLLVKWLHIVAQKPGFIGDMVLLLQKEVAGRLTAAPCTKAYGRLSVMSQWLCEVSACFDIGARAFTPPPKVDSTVVRLAPRAAPLAPATFGDMETVVRAAFGQRRKMLRASLRSLAGQETAALLAAAGLRGEARAEELTVADFAALARAWRSSAKGA